MLRLAPGSDALVRFIEDAERMQASDVHFHAATPPVVRVHGRLIVTNAKPLDVREQERQLLGLLDPVERETFLETSDLDFALITPSGLRLRANMYRTHVGVEATFRLVRRQPPTLEDLHLPATLAGLVEHHQGLVLVTGPAGCGKSSTLAAMVNLINSSRAEHVLAFEDPIEIVHPPKRALVNQRQVGRDTESFARALRGALREDPDVIVVGDLRDRETIALAITAAETGHLVIGSMNTNSASRTIARLIDAFPPAQQPQVRAMLSESLRGVVSQRLVPAIAGGRLPAVELLIGTPAMGNLIREGKLSQIRSQMQTGRSIGMRTLDESLRDLVHAGRVSLDEARKLAETPAMITAKPAGAPDPASAMHGASSVTSRHAFGMPRQGSRS